MAKVQFTAVVNDIRGKLSGSQFSKNKSGAILQVKGSQKATPTAAQSAVRSKFSYLARLWRGLSEAEIMANNAAALAYPYTDRFGQTKYLSGYALLLRSNINRDVSDFAPISVVPAVPPAGLVLTDLTAVAQKNGSSAVEINLTWADTGTGGIGYVVQAFVSPVLAGSVINYSGAYLFAVWDDAGASVLQINEFNYQPLATAQVGAKFFLKFVVVHTASGVEVSSYVIPVVVTAI